MPHHRPKLPPAQGEIAYTVNQIRQAMQYFVDVEIGLSLETGLKTMLVLSCSHIILT